MAAANTDTFPQVAVAGSQTTLTAPGKAIGVSSVNLTSSSGWPTTTGIIFALRRVDSNGNYVAGTYTEWAGVLVGTTITLNTTPIYGTDQTYAADGLTQAFIPVSATWANRIINALLIDHVQGGYHTNLHDSNGNLILELSPTASAVNEIKVANNITGKNPQIIADGSDSAVGVDIVSKGTGISRIDGAAPQKFFAIYNFIESGCVWSGDSYGSTLNGSMTAGVVWINGKRLTVAAITAHAFTASKDTYIDFQDNGDGTASVTYTLVSNNAASPALPNSATDSTNVRNAIIITGASSIANSGSVNQGQETAVLPIASSIAYSVTDSLGNLICPRDPNRKILGFRQIVAGVTGISTEANVTGLSCPVNVPTGRKIKISIMYPNLSASTTTISTSAIWDGTVGSGTQLNKNQVKFVDSSYTLWSYLEIETTPSSSAKTYNAAVNTSPGTINVNASSTAPAFIKVELV